MELLRSIHKFIEILQECASVFVRIPQGFIFIPQFILLNSSEVQIFLKFMEYFRSKAPQKPVPVYIDKGVRILNANSLYTVHAWLSHVTNTVVTFIDPANTFYRLYFYHTCNFTCSKLHTVPS